MFPPPLFLLIPVSHFRLSGVLPECYSSFLSIPLRAVLCQSTEWPCPPTWSPVPGVWRTLTALGWINFCGSPSGSLRPCRPFAWGHGPTSMAAQAACSSRSAHFALSRFYHILPVSVSSLPFVLPGMGTPVLSTSRMGSYSPSGPSTGAFGRNCPFLLCALTAVVPFVTFLWCLKEFVLF